MTKDDKIPVILLSGYLGAGKTTVLSRILQDDALNGRKIAVLVNDFGALPVDVALLPRGDYHVSKINKGSIFCVCVKTDLIGSLREIAEKISPDLLLIEATGLAEPGDFSSLLQTDFLRKSYRRSAVVTIVDAVNFPKLSKIIRTLSAQICVADLIVVNKTDLADKEGLSKIRDAVSALNSSAKIIETSFGKIPEGAIDFFRAAAGRGDISPGNSSLGLCSSAPEDIFRCEFRRNTPVDRVRFYEFLDLHRNHVLRGKGIVDFGDAICFVEVINGTVSSRPAGDIRIDCGFRSAMSFVLRKMNDKEFLGKMEKV